MVNLIAMVEFFFPDIWVNVTILSVFMYYLEAKDSIRSVTTRAFDILSANTNTQKFNICEWLIEPTEMVCTAPLRMNKAKMDIIFKIGYKARTSFENFIKLR
jgi:hypothetical protein